MHQFPPSHIVLGNHTGRLTVENLADLAAYDIREFAETLPTAKWPPEMTSEVIALAHDRLRRARS